MHGDLRGQVRVDPLPDNHTTDPPTLGQGRISAGKRQLDKKATEGEWIAPRVVSCLSSAHLRIKEADTSTRPSPLDDRLGGGFRWDGRHREGQRRLFHRWPCRAELLISLLTG